jgi:hypothetical protein
MNELKLRTNVPEEIALKFPEPKEYPSKFENSPPRYMWTLADGRVLWLTAKQNERLLALQPQPGEPLDVCNVEKTGNGRKWIEFEVSRVGEPQPAASVPAPAAVQPLANGSGRIQQTQGNSKYGHGELAVPKLNGGSNGHGTNIAMHPEPPAPPPAPAVHQGHFQFLVQQTQSLINAYAACLAYSEQQHGTRVRPDDVRSLLLSMFINITGGKAK